jgi:hypothetical protein
MAEYIINYVVAGVVHENPLPSYSTKRVILAQGRTLIEAKSKHSAIAKFSKAEHKKHRDVARNIKVSCKISGYILTY